MTARVFADHCVPTSVQFALREAGHEVIRLRDRLPANAVDPDVIAEAVALDAALLTLDGDFSDIVAYPPARYRGILALQVRGRTEILPALTERLVRYLAEQSGPEALVGRLFLVEVHRIRIVG